jgi:hypothetical protein
MKITLDKTSNLTDVVMGEVQELRGEVSAGKGELSDLCAGSTFFQLWFKSPADNFSGNRL